MLEATSATSSGSPHTPILTVTGGGFVPPPPIRTMTIQTPTSLGSGIVPLMTMTIVPSSQNMYEAPFRMGCQVSNIILP